MKWLLTIGLIATLTVVGGGCAHRNACSGCIIDSPMLVRSEMVQASGCDLPPLPRILPDIAVMYPYEMRRAWVTGRVDLQIDVSDVGLVDAVWITSSTAPEFTDAVAAGFARITFLPARSDGLPVRSTVSYIIRFVIDDE